MASLDAAGHALAGAVGGIVSTTATYPLLTVTTRMQVHGKEYGSALQTLQKILAEEKWTGLFSGIQSAWFGISVTQAVYYYWFEFFKAHAENRTGQRRAMSTAESLIVSSLAGVVTVFATNPIWVVNTQMQMGSKDPTRRGPPLSSTQTALHILRTDGWTGFFRGVLPALILVANPTVQYTVYEQLKGRYEASMLRALVKAGHKSPRTPQLTAFQVFYISAIAKTVATVLTYPLQIVKSRLQAAKSTGAQQSPAHGHGIVSILSNIYRDDGFGGFFKGMNAKITQSVLTAAILFLTKEKVASFTLKLVNSLGPATKQ